MKSTEENYQKMLFREALRTGFFEMQQARDKYRELTQNENGMNAKLVHQFIQWQALALSPICPHIAEFLWMDCLANKSSILRQSWPELSQVDEIVIKSSAYLMEAAREFRLKLKAACLPPKAKKGQPPSAAKPAKPTHAVVYVAKTYPPWQCTVLSTLKEMYQATGWPKGPAPDNKELSKKLMALPELKKWMKKVMPFVAWAKERVGDQGLSALDLTLEFDEKKVLEDNVTYLLSTLGLDGLEVQFSSEANEKTQEECRPGVPFINFRTEPSVTIQMINNQPHSGLFQFACPILEADTVSSVAKRMSRNERNIKDWSKVKLFRYEDPILGPRKMPSLLEPMVGKVQMAPEGTFKIDLNSEKVTFDGKDLGGVIVYRIIE